MPKGCGTIVLDEKVGNPREGVWNHDGGSNEPFVAKENCRYDQCPADESSGGMENAGQWLAMGQNIVRPEISEGAWLMHGHGADCNAAGRRTDLKKNAIVSLQEGETMARLQLNYY